MKPFWIYTSIHIPVTILIHILCSVLNLKSFCGFHAVVVVVYMYAADRTEWEERIQQHTNNRYPFTTTTTNEKRGRTFIIIKFHVVRDVEDRLRDVDLFVRFHIIFSLFWIIHHSLSLLPLCERHIFGGEYIYLSFNVFSLQITFFVYSSAFTRESMCIFQSCLTVL